MMAEQLELSQSAVSRIWRAFGLKPHRSEKFQISKDPYFIEKVRDVVGLYMSPPTNALVLLAEYILVISPILIRESILYTREFGLFDIFQSFYIRL